MGLKDCCKTIYLAVIFVVLIFVELSKGQLRFD